VIKSRASNEVFKKGMLSKKKGMKSGKNIKVEIPAR